MTLFRKLPDDSNEIRPSLAYNGILALGCLIMAVILFRTGPMKVEGAGLMAIFLVLSAGVIMATHLPGCTGIWFDKDGFLMREMYRSERYRWAEIGPFIVRRRALGSSVDFPFTLPGETMPETRSLPRGLGRSAWKLARMMNERRARAVGAEG